MQDQAAYPQATKYITNRDFVFAAIAGAPDKTIVYALLLYQA